MKVNTAQEDLQDSDCKKGHVAQRLPILYVPVTSVFKTSTSTESIKVKLNVTDYLICLEILRTGTMKNKAPDDTSASTRNEEGGRGAATGNKESP
jgi:hypothetical protein